MMIGSNQTDVRTVSERKHQRETNDDNDNSCGNTVMLQVHIIATPLRYQNKITYTAYIKTA